MKVTNRLNKPVRLLFRNKQDKKLPVSLVIESAESVYGLPKVDILVIEEVD